MTGLLLLAAHVVSVSEEDGIDTVTLHKRTIAPAADSSRIFVVPDYIEIGESEIFGYHLIN